MELVVALHVTSQPQESARGGGQEQDIPEKTPTSTCPMRYWARAQQAGPSGLST
jgi:hypothetical protein